MVNGRLNLPDMAKPPLPVYTLCGSIGN